MGHTFTTLVGLSLGSALFAACSGSADSGSPRPSPSPSSASPTTPSATPTPTAPAMSEAAKAHTKAGAIAFVEHFWAVVNYAQATGDTTALRAISNPGCDGCEAGIAAIEKTYQRGGKVVGGRATLSSLQAELLLAGEAHLAHVTYSIRIGEQHNDFPGTAADAVEPGYRSRDRLELVQESPASGWRAAQLVVLE